MKNMIPKQDAQVWTANAVSRQMEDIDVKNNSIWERKLSYQEKKLGNKIVIIKNKGDRGLQSLWIKGNVKSQNTRH